METHIYKPLIEKNARPKRGVPVEVTVRSSKLGHVLDSLFTVPSQSYYVAKLFMQSLQRVYATEKRIFE